jgi:hypothetical protein
MPLVVSSAALLRWGFMISVRYGVLTVALLAIGGCAPAGGDGGVTCTDPQGCVAQ